MKFQSHFSEASLEKEINVPVKIITKADTTKDKGGR
jgi:hypothetical protein